MWVGVVSLFPEMFEAITRHGVTGRAVSQGRIALEFWNPRDYASDRHRTVDDRPYGGGPGMLMKVDTLRAAIHAARERAGEATGRRPRVIYLSPQGRRLDQQGVHELASGPPLVVVAGRYEGIDERIVESDIDEEWSIGDYVLSGGELPAMVLIDAAARLVPGVLGHQDSAVEDSFNEGLLDCPHYTRPEEIDGRRVPEVLLSGHHGEIRRWRLKQSLGRTWLRRPDLLEGRSLSDEQRKLLEEFIEEYASSDK
ncbi:tRNA (guanosine(37)-N1)-methyltransferase TrmD [Halomonas sp. MCCC 1A17488]|uniref:tRNA (guanine-N(1)-)-methyltransferase n=1 Tax=Billgrantia sulfidoxydans TaxID=2733484 RepID=A0ABX7VZF6_9GAMM|nr:MULTISPECIES: tRNA (guanosine(37)-N1)-methyltransferase TrmD [Halomonas]MCE8016803.1 tRNA (guanosine(37)-N1)-methyltransferase TrmD [Halomonas sp. MCCC 1A17488]MCG3240136.1 tRNA (guanosine(37)-N1)-methyltransferase TrmD [Halomonas sp. MCCC 1A17488]QPP49984.1 tRNA (guanosine(37)-N1)-methyltransferase TrmD [Halomonas sp. SS10-MC5]QTP53596.1 tRNA (guanosine(37)-N1)-methyltransferase TrmD [Halomonas sulfidoxydans]